MSHATIPTKWVNPCCLPFTLATWVCLPFPPFVTILYQIKLLFIDRSIGPQPPWILKAHVSPCQWQMIQEETSLWRTSEKVMGFAGAGSNLHEYTFSLKSAVLNNGGDIQQQRHCSYSKSSLAEEWGLIWCTYLSTVRTLSSWIHHACLHDGQETAVQDVPVSAPILRPFLRIPSAPDSEGERLHDQGTQFNRKRTSAPCKHRWEKLQRSEYRLKKWWF